MLRNPTKIIFKFTLLILSFTAFSQTRIEGTIVDSDGDPLIGVNVLVEGTVLGTITNIEGKYALVVKSSSPLTIKISYIGYETQIIKISKGRTLYDIQLSESTLLGQEIVISASRVPESSLKSPVSIERMDIIDIQNSADPDFYNSIKNLNGIDLSTQSLTFQTINARGFGANGNNRFVQLIDGIDNQAPGLNFSAGNLVGIGELDIESVELIPGASSALYGPNALQGILLLKSKSPFDYQGLDIYSKLGTTHTDENDHSMALYKDLGFRYAKAFNNKWAFKLNVSQIQAQDFIGVDERDQNGSESNGVIRANLTSNRENNRVYDGVNIYGDFQIDIGAAADMAIAAGEAEDAKLEEMQIAEQLRSIRSLLPNGLNGAFSPTGYAEKDFIDNSTESLKLGAALHYRINDKIEVFGQFNWGQGSTVYTANDRFILDNFSIWTAKLEVRGDNFFVRGYTTQENSGDTYAANTVASLINGKNYLPVYFRAYLDFLTGMNTTGANPAGTSFASNNYNALHDAARQVADGARLDPNSKEFQDDFNTFRNMSIADGGSRFEDKSSLWHYEGSYNFKNQIKFADVVIGTNFRTYKLNSGGSIFTLDDNDDEVSFNEYGGYVQIAKEVLTNLKIQASIRYDKNENFDGQFSPRISSVWEFLPFQNLRGSFQRGFRIPTSQDQYVDLDVVTSRLLGRNELLERRYNINRNTVYTTESVQKSQISGNITDLVVAADAYRKYKTEKVNTWEVGYKGLLFNGRLLVDAFFFSSLYQDFSAEINVTQAVTVGAELTGDEAIPSGYEVGKGIKHSDAQLTTFVEGGAPGIALQRYGYDVNIDRNISTYGYGLGLEYTFFRGFNLGGNASYNKIKDLDDITARTYNIAFNTPDWRYNIKFGNRKITKHIGFGLTYRWQNAYLWQSAIGSGIVPAFGTLDAQITYNIPTIKGRIKLGGSNVLNNRYTTSLANPNLGSLYYVQLNLDNILSNF